MVVKSNMLKLIYFLMFSFFTLVSSSAVADLSKVYKRCISSHEVCYVDRNVGQKGQVLSNRDGRNGFYATLFDEGQAIFSHYMRPSADKEIKRVSSVSVSRSGLVGRNLEANKPFPVNQNINNTFPAIRIAFEMLPPLNKKRLQRQLHRLALYNSKIDGIWGKNTYKAILTYNTIFKKRIGVHSVDAAIILQTQILSHERFNYKDGKIQPKKCSDDPEKCTASQLCLFAVKKIGDVIIWQTDPKWMKHVAKAKERALQCGVNSLNTCKWNAAACDDVALCNYAVSPGIGQKIWETRHNWLQHVNEAKRRRLSCGTQDRSANSAEDEGRLTQALMCTRNPATCSIQELCKRASVTVSGITRWRTSDLSLPFVETAKKVWVGLWRIDCSTG